MKSISKNIKNEIIIDKSKFITYLIRVDSKEDIKYHLERLREEYRDATHVCYCYCLGSEKKASDDGEPSGTASQPMLNVIDKNELNNVLAVVIRYFGGIKLGAGGLVRAYSNSVREALNNTSIVTLEEGYLIEIEYPYEMTKDIDYFLRDKEVTYKEFDLLIKVSFKIKKSNINEVDSLNIPYKIIKEIYIEK